VTIDMNILRTTVLPQG